MNKIKHTILLTLALMLSGGAWAQWQWTSGDCTATIDASNSMLIIRGNGNMADYESSFDRPWDIYKSDITGLVIEEGVTSIGDYAFFGFSNTYQVILPEGVKTIGVGAFRSSNTLTYVSIPASVTSIGDKDVFYNCINLTDVFLYADPANLTWPEDGNDFMSGKATLCHVRPEYLNTYQSNFANVNVTFVGDLPSLNLNLAVEVTQDANLDWFFTMPPSNAEVGVAYFPLSTLTFGANNSNGGTVAIGDTLKYEEFTTTTDPGNYSEGRYHFVGEQFQIDAKSFDRDGIHLGSTTVRAIKNQPIVKIEATIGYLNWCQTCYAYYIPKNQSQQRIPRPYSVGLTKTIDNINAQSVDFIGTALYTIQFNKWKVYYNDHSIVYNQDDSYTVRNGSKVTLNAQANEGWHVAGWKDGNGNEMETATYGEGTNPATSSLTFTMTCDTHAVAYFDTNVYNVSVNVNDEEGSVSGPAMVKHFRSGTYTASAKTCYHFVNWTDAAGTVLGTEETISIAAVSDTAITAHFAKDVYAGDTTAEACDRFAWHDITYTATPVEAPTFGYKTVNGCDSTVTLRLTINYSNAGDTTAEACDRFAWHGTTYTETPLVAPTYVMANTKGCDSTVTLLLTICHSTTGDTTAEACDRFAWHGTTYTSTPAVAPTYVLTNAEGCDSTVTLLLTIRHSTAGDTTATACDKFAWYGTNYIATPAEAPTYVLTNAEGCDSTVTLLLTIRHSTAGDTTATACDKFAWHSTNYIATPAEAPIYVMTNAEGCDSTVTLLLTIRHSTTGDTTAEACDQFAWHGTTYTATPLVAPTYVMTNAEGCDSTVTLYLTINYSTAGDTTAEACDQFAWHGTTYTATPLVAPTYVMTNAEGCDSTVTLLLTIRHSTTGDTTATACDEFVWHGITYTETPEEAPTYVFDNATGCDSTVTLHLTIRHSNSGIETATACDRYEWQGTVYTESNTTDQHILTNIEGCDSTVTLNLTINYHHDTTVYYQSSGEFEFLGVTYSDNGTYPRVIETTEGCDSNITLVLAYLPRTTPLPTIYNILDVTLFINHFPEGTDKIDYIYYRWYKNGEVVSEGEGKDSYSEDGDILNGCFYLEISTEPTHTYWAKSNEVCLGNLGIDGAKDITMTMAPNPVVRGQQVSVTVSESNLQGAVVNVYDAQGRQVMNFELRNSNFEIPTSTLVSGIYTVRIVLADGRTATKKIVVK